MSGHLSFFKDLTANQTTGFYAEYLKVIGVKPLVVQIVWPEGVHLLSAKLRIYVSSTFFIPLNIEENIIYSTGEIFHKLHIS